MTCHFDEIKTLCEPSFTFSKQNQQNVVEGIVVVGILHDHV